MRPHLNSGHNYLRLTVLTAIFLVSFKGTVQVGADRIFEKDYFQWIKGKRIGLITNPTGVDSKMRLTADLLDSHPEVSLTALFAPEHGLYGAAQAGEKVTSTKNIYSLYGENRAPTSEMLADVDVLIYDIQDVGVRFYTYLSTMYESMKAAAAHGIPFIVLDRPNPIDATRVQGVVLEPGYESFVGIYRMPIRYGMTVGEMARLMNSEGRLGCDLRVVPLRGWKREDWYDETGLQWIFPSPNIPTLATATVYPGTCLIEGTNLSEGRGTTRPFELFGAPWLDSKRLAEALNTIGLQGVHFRAQAFTPWFSKHKGELCQGIQIHVLDRDTFDPIRTVLHILHQIMTLQPGRLEFNRAFDRLCGTSQVREALLRGDKPATIENSWKTDLEHFRQIREKYLLY
ncbi:MAG TPA: DUF1343 domain-containing protein [Acidobacteriota bacterium]|nr:DUF1343 domain-containing protein [Acidobacteriota bacterium]